MKSETDEDTKDTITGIDEESQGDNTESKVPMTKLSFYNHRNILLINVFLYSVSLADRETRIFMV